MSDNGGRAEEQNGTLGKALEAMSEEELRAKLDELRSAATATDQDIEKLNEAIEALEKRSNLVKQRLAVASSA